jgi:hypothetical protein
MLILWINLGAGDPCARQVRGNAVSFEDRTSEIGTRQDRAAEVRSTKHRTAEVGGREARTDQMGVDQPGSREVGRLAIRSGTDGGAVEARILEACPTEINTVQKGSVELGFR